MSNHHHNNSHDQNHKNSIDHAEEHHIMPLATYFKVAGALFVLTFLTVAFHAIHEYLGPFAALIAFGIAAIKAFMVMAWFMHLKYDSILNRLIFASGFIFLGLLFIMSVMDIYTRLTVNSVL